MSSTGLDILLNALIRLKNHVASLVYHWHNVKKCLIN